ncbi:hypothetical protein [Halalkalibacter alkalisediminis]|uniref:Uncharacterized protein n=1 Tax=Halalkalibacter alkalisediminis TaxID=935616 RepID=A0ABV6NGM6_9BACI|nr:hypothetical protein [Halalkalibacter alkalisediminis]
MRKGLLGLLGLIVLGVIVGLDIRVTTNEQDEQIELDLQLEEEELGMVFLDLPNGESTYLELPDGETILIGTGAKDSSEELFTRLNKLNVSHINTIILPRFEKEYSGNVEKMVTQFQTDQLIVPNQGLSQAITQYQYLGIDIVGWEEEEDYDISEFLQIKTLSNHSSLMPMLSFIITVHNKHRFFFSSEANEQLERNWLEKGLSPVTLLKVAEFGTDEGTTQRFLKEIDPQVAILFSKENAEISGALLERLQETWIDTYTMNQNGSVILKVNEFDYELVTVHF